MPNRKVFFFLCYKTKLSRRGNLSWTRNSLLVRSKWKIVNIMKTLCFYLVCFKSCESTHYTPVVLMCFFLCALSTSQMSDCCWNLYSAWDNCFVFCFLSALPLLILNMDWKTGRAIYHQQLLNQLKQQTYNLNISVCFSLSVDQCQHFL